jgi:hypothetical protein
LKSRYDIKVLEIFLKSSFLAFVVIFLVVGLIITSYNYSDFNVIDSYELIIFVFSNEIYTVVLLSALFVFTVNHIVEKYYTNYNVLIHFQSTKAYIRSIINCVIKVTVVVLLINFMIIIIYGNIEGLSIISFVRGNNGDDLIKLILYVFLVSILYILCNLIFLLIKLYFSNSVSLLMQIVIIFLPLISGNRILNKLGYLNPLKVLTDISLVSLPTDLFIRISICILLAFLCIFVLKNIDVREN